MVLTVSTDILSIVLIFLFLLDTKAKNVAYSWTWEIGIYIFMLVTCAVQNQEFHLKSNPASSPCWHDENIQA